MFACLPVRTHVKMPDSVRAIRSATEAAGEVGHEFHGGISAIFLVLLLEQLQRVLHHLAGGVPSGDCGHRGYGESILWLIPHPTSYHSSCGHNAATSCTRNLYLQSIPSPGVSTCLPCQVC